MEIENSSIEQPSWIETSLCIRLPTPTKAMQSEEKDEIF